MYKSVLSFCSNIGYQNGFQSAEGRVVNQRGWNNILRKLPFTPMTGKRINVTTSRPIKYELHRKTWCSYKRPDCTVRPCFYRSIHKPCLNFFVEKHKTLSYKYTTGSNPRFHEFEYRQENKTPLRISTPKIRMIKDQTREGNDSHRALTASTPPPHITSPARVRVT